MKKLTIIAVSLLTTMYSCTPGGGTTTPVTPTPTPTTPSSTYSITLNGHTYNRTPALRGVVVGIGVIPGNSQVQIDITDASYIRMWFWGDKADTTSKIGTYIVSADYIIDWGDHGIIYKLGLAPKGTITVTTYTAHQIKGTFNVNGKTGLDTLIHNITGSFDYNY